MITRMIGTPDLAGPVGASTFVVKPGVAASGTTFRTLADAVTATSLVTGYKALQFDNTIQYASSASAKTFAVDSGVVTLTDPNAPFNALMVGQSLSIASDTTSVASAASAKTITIGAGAVVTFVDPNAPFTPDWVGKVLTLAGSTTPANDGAKTIASYVDPTTVTYVSATAVTEAFPGTWTFLPNNGTFFQVASCVSPTQITYANPLAVAGAFPGTWAIGLTCIIPAGAYNMRDVEWMGLTSPAVVISNPVIIDVLEGAQFTNLRAIGGQVNINNRATVTPPNVFTVPTSVEFGLGPSGDNPNLGNLGGAPFWDSSALPNGVPWTLRQTGVLQGTSPAINLGGNSGTRLTHGLAGFSIIAANMIRGTNASSAVNLQYGGSGGAYAQQPNFAGAINQTVSTFARHSIRPAPPAAPSAVALTFATGLQVNTVHLLNPGAGANIAQPLPIVKAVTPLPATGNGPVQAAGALLNTGTWATFVNTTDPALPGAKDVVLSTATVLEKINGVAAATLTVKPGCSVTVYSDGVDGWRTGSDYLGPPSAAYTPTNVTPDRSFDADTIDAGLVPELADVVGTLIADLQAKGILG